MRLAPTAPGTSRTLTTSVEVPGRPGVVLKEGMTVALAIAVGSGCRSGSAGVGLVVAVGGG